MSVGADRSGCLGIPHAMTLGKTVILAMGMAILAALSGGLLHAGEILPAYCPEVPEVSRYGEAAGLVSLRKNAVVTIGGEIRVDYSFTSMRTSVIQPKIDSRIGDLSLRQANIRLVADVHPNISAIFKLNLSADSDRSRDRDEVLEEALVVMRSVGGTGLGFFAGKGRAPYGQDVTLGMLQSYAHAANRLDSAEGRVFIVDPPDDVTPANPGQLPVAPMRPGQFDRTFMAGASYEWSPRWKVEAALFQPNDFEYSERLRNRRSEREGSDIGAAARLWWRPIEDLTLEASAMVTHSGAMARVENRLDVGPDAAGRKFAYAVSAGFDWRRGPWRVFGEYQHGWDWNFTKDYRTDSWQIGLARDFATGWRAGGMAEGLRIGDKEGRHTVDNYYKLALNVRYMFSSGLFVVAEYGHEWFRRDRNEVLADKRRGDFFGLRLGFSF